MYVVTCDFPNPGGPAIRHVFPSAMRWGQSQRIASGWISEARREIRTGSLLGGGCELDGGPCITLAGGKRHHRRSDFGPHALELARLLIPPIEDIGRILDIARLRMLTRR